MITAISNKAIRILLTALIIVAAVYPLFSKSVGAGNLTAMSDTMTRQTISVASNHTITFDQTATTQFVAGETITIDLDDGFDTTTLSTADPKDFDIVVGPTEEAIVAAAGCGATDSIELTSISGTDVITLTACGSYTSEAAGVVITVEIGTNAGPTGGTGDSQITNPGTNLSKTISIGGTFGDTGSFAVPILTTDQVTVSATIDPTITSTITGAPCTITPAITSTIVDSCSYTNQVATNAASGYASTLLEVGDLRTGALTISDVSDGTVTDTGVAEEYGASTSSTNVGAQDILVWDGACEVDGTDISEIASPIIGTAKRYADHGGPVDETTTICHSASIISTTEAGSYSHIVTHITTGTF